jgi:hypothetical protein
MFRKYTYATANSLKKLPRSYSSGTAQKFPRKYTYGAAKNVLAGMLPQLPANAAKVYFGQRENCPGNPLQRYRQVSPLTLDSPVFNGKVTRDD